MVILGIRLKVSFWLFRTILWSLFKIFINIIDILSSVQNLGNTDQMLLSVINTKEERKDIEIKAGHRDQKGHKRYGLSQIDRPYMKFTKT